MKGLNARERVLIFGGGVVVACLALWIYVWQPLVAERAAQEDRIARYLAVIQLAQTADTLSIPATQATAPELPLASRITQSARDANIELARLDPDGPRLRVTVANADYADLIGWIAVLENDAQAIAVSAEMARQIEPGHVSLRLMLENAQ